MTKEKMQETQDLMIKYHGPEEPAVDLSEAFTNEFLT